MPPSVKTLCCEQDVGVYVAPDLGQLERRIDRKEKVWCGWEHFLGGPDNECTAHVNPFGQNFIAIADHRHRSLFSAGVPCQPDCSCHALGSSWTRPKFGGVYTRPSRSRVCGRDSLRLCAVALQDLAHELWSFMSYHQCD